MFEQRGFFRRVVQQVSTAAALVASLVAVSFVITVAVSCDGAEPTTNLTAGASSGEFTTASGSVETTQYTPTTEAIAAEPLLLDEGRVRVLCVLDEEARDIPNFTIQPEQVDLAAIASSVLGEGAQMKTGVDSQGNEWVRFFDGENELGLEVASGRVSLLRHGLAQLNSSIALDYEAAKTMAEEFVSKAGGLPLGCFLTRVSGMNVQNIGTGGEPTQLTWSFRYSIAVDGTLVYGPGGVGILVTLADDGVYQYNRWVPLLVEQDVSERILSAEEAVTIAAPALRSAFSSAPIRDSVDIVGVQLVYFSPTHFDYEKYGTDRLRPAYSLSADGENLPIQIDAVDGSILTMYD